MPLYYLENSRNDEQRAKMVQLEEEGVCLFCPDHLYSTNDQEVLRQTTYWSVMPNRYPYRGARLHLLLTPTEHVSDILALPAAALADFWIALQWVSDHYRLTFYSFAARCGDCRYTGGTIEHVHVHVIVGDVEDVQHVPIRMKLSSKADAAS